MKSTRLFQLATAIATAASMGACDDNLPLQGRSLPTNINIETTLGDTVANAPFVAIQEGDEPWRALNGLAGRYAFVTVTGRFATAVFCPSIGPQSPQKILLQYLTYLDTDLVQAFCAGPSTALAPQKLSGTVSGLTAGEAVVLLLGDGSSRQLAATGPTVTLDIADAPSGIYDIIIAKGTADAAVGVKPNRVIIRRNVDVSRDATLNVDFSGTSITPQPFALSALGALASETTKCSAEFFGSFAILPLAAADAPTLPDVPGVPTNAQGADEFHFGVCAASTDSTLRSAERFFKAPGPVTLSLPEAFSTPAMTATASAPYVRLAARFSGVPSNAWVNIDASQDAMGTTPRTVWSTSLSPTWMQQTPATGGDRTVALPALSGLAGWSDTYGLQPGRPIKWSIGWELTTLGRSIAEGSAIRSQKRGTLTP